MAHSSEYERGAENARRMIENSGLEFAKGSFDDNLAERGLAEPQDDYDIGYQSVLRAAENKS